MGVDSNGVGLNNSKAVVSIDDPGVNTFQECVKSYEIDAYSKTVVINSYELEVNRSKVVINSYEEDVNCFVVSRTYYA